jgi:hypothetical protein
MKTGTPVKGMKHPTLDELKALVQKYDLQGIILIAYGKGERTMSEDDDNLALVTYGFDKQQCKRMARIGDRIFDREVLVATCRVCGCTEEDACEGGCSWIEDDLCSACHKKGKS